MVLFFSGEVEKWRSGEVEKWRSGEVEKWRSGEVEKWRSGEVEKWRSGEVSYNSGLFGKRDSKSEDLHLFSVSSYTPKVAPNSQ